MKTLLLFIAAILIIAGVVGIVAGGISYVKDRDTAKIGAVDITVAEKDRISIPPIVGALLLLGGAGLLYAAKRQA